MYFVAIAVDYDGTLATDGKVDPQTVDALRRLKQSGRKLILVSGRELAGLARDFSSLDVFDLAVLENGAVLYDPAARSEIALTAAPPSIFVESLKQRGVAPLSVGEGIVATWEPNETIVLEAIRDLGLDLQIIFNKGAVMVLPAGINKASGLAAALKKLRLSPHNVVGIGDAENDLAFLAVCGCSVAVENAIGPVTENADLRVAARGAGVIELVELLLKDDLRGAGDEIPKARPLLGTRNDGSAVTISPYESALITGSSGGGKSTTVTALLEQMGHLDFQFCVIDPEGDYGDMAGAVVVGDPQNHPVVKEVMSLLDDPGTNVIVNLLAIDPVDRPSFLSSFLPELIKLRAATGRPHWIVIDEAHHCLPAARTGAAFTLPQELPAAIAVTVHPESVDADFLKLFSIVIGVGNGSVEAIGKFCAAIGRSYGGGPTVKLEKGQVHLLRADGQIDVISANLPEAKLRRHIRKYAEGALGEDRSFYFRGPHAALNLRAQNLSMFLQMAAGVDDETWLHHLRLNDYSKWFRTAIKDDALADDAFTIEGEGGDAQVTRARITAVVQARYTAPAKADE